MKFVIIYFDNGSWERIISTYDFKEALEKKDRIINSGIPAYIMGYTDFIESGLPIDPPEKWDFDKKEFKKESKE